MSTTKSTYPRPTALQLAHPHLHSAEKEISMPSLFALEEAEELEAAC